MGDFDDAFRDRLVELLEGKLTQAQVESLRRELAGSPNLRARMDEWIDALIDVALRDPRLHPAPDAPGVAEVNFHVPSADSLPVLAPAPADGGFPSKPRRRRLFVVPAFRRIKWRRAGLVAGTLALASVLVVMLKINASSSLATTPPLQLTEAERDVLFGGEFKFPTRKPPAPRHVPPADGRESAPPPSGQSALKEVYDIIQKGKRIDQIAPFASRVPLSARTLHTDSGFSLEQVDQASEGKNLANNLIMMDQAGLRPGVVVNGGDFLLRNQVTPVSGPPLAPQTFGFKDVLIRTKQDGDPQKGLRFTRTLVDPDYVKYNEMLLQWLEGLGDDAKIFSNAADVSWKFIQAYSTSDAESKLGIRASFLDNFKLDMSKQAREENRTAQVFGVFVQKYFTVVVAEPKAADGGPFSCLGYFGPSITPEHLKGVAEIDPLLYVDSCAYGRMLVVSVDAQGSSKEIQEALNVGASGFGGKLDVDTLNKYKRIVDTATFTVRVYGGTTEGVGPMLTLNGFEGITKINAWIASGLDLVPTRLPKDDEGKAVVPKVVGFSLRHLADNSTVATPLLSEYSVMTSNPFTPEARVRVDHIHIFKSHDDHFFRGDGDWLLYVRKAGGAVDLLGVGFLAGDNKEFRPGWFSQSIPTEGKESTLSLHIRMGEEDGGAGWDKFPWDEGVQTYWNIEIDKLDFKTLDLSKPISETTIRDSDGNFATLSAYITLPDAVLKRLRGEK